MEEFGRCNKLSVTGPPVPYLRPCPVRVHGVIREGDGHRRFMAKVRLCHDCPSRPSVWHVLQMALTGANATPWFGQNVPDKVM